MKNTAPEIVSDIRTLFREAAVPENAAPMQAYMKNIALFLGIKAPERKALQKEIFRHYSGLPFPGLEAVLRLLMAQPEREFHYLAVEWLYHRRKDFRADTIILIETLLTTKSWWDTVDFLAARCLGIWAKMFPNDAPSVIARFLQSTDFWLNRSAMLHQLHYREKTDTKLLTATLEPHLTSREFFLRKAIGWALRQYARTNPGWVVAFVDAHPEMSGLSRREALRAMP